MKHQFVALGLVLFATSAANAADVGKGRTLAVRWCAACHIVAPDQKEAKADAPPFNVVARTRTAATLNAFLSNPYPRMPDMSLSRDEIADLVVYIKSMGLAPGETPPPPPLGTDSPPAANRG